MTRPSVEQHYGAYLIGSRVDPETGDRGRLVQCDFDYPAEASALGWSMRRVQRTDGSTRVMKRAPNRGHGCDHSSTDGTVDCSDCGVRASEFIAAAGDYLDGLC